MPKVTHNPQPEVEEHSSYVVIIPSATEAMVDEIIDAFRVCDLMAIAQKGTLEDVYRRLNGNR